MRDSGLGFEELLSEKGCLLADGATGTNLFAMGLESGEAPEAWLNEHPDRIQALHQSFVDAGSDLFLTNTFGGTKHRLKLHDLDGQVTELNRKAARLARDVADNAGRPVLVAGSVGPTGEILAPLGSLEKADAVESFKEQMEGLVEGGVDLIWIETISAPDELEAAAEAARTFDVPVCATMSFDSAGRTMMGLTPRAFASLATDFNLDGFGANCGVGAADLMSSVLGFMDAKPTQPVIAKANCGIPSYEDGKIVYSGTVEQMASYALLARAAGAKVIGGCCGTKAEHIAAMRKALDEEQQPDFRVLAIELALGKMSEGARQIAIGQDALKSSERRSGNRRRRS
ncbi:MAG: betaine--homocysteine S-methyltransferase [Alphaproteobacteria bacterium]